jgi:hypothetical protein
MAFIVRYLLARGGGRSLLGLLVDEETQLTKLLVSLCAAKTISLLNLGRSDNGALKSRIKRVVNKLVVSVDAGSLVIGPLVAVVVRATSRF